MTANTGKGSGRPHLNYLDIVKAKRQEAADKQQAGKQDKLLVHSSRESAAKIAGEVARQSARSRVNTQRVEVANPVTTVKTPDIQEVVKTVEQLTDVIKEQRPDDTNLLSAVGELNKTLHELPKKIVIPKPEKLTSIAVSNHPDYSERFSEVTRAVKSLEVSPVVKVDAPKVTVPAPDISGIEKAVSDIKGVIEAEKSSKEFVDLSKFRAQEIDDTAPSMQYVGLLAPDGDWQIIENSTEDNTLRYAFGRGNYGLAWERRVQLNYRLLDEACRELSA